MLTTRGFWFFLIASGVLAAAVLLGAAQLTLLALTLLLWFLGQWVLFQVRIRLAVRRLVVGRILRTSRGEVQSLWAKQKVEVVVTLRGAGVVGLPYVVMTERVPALARVEDGTALCLDGAVSAEEPLTLTYSLECPAAGWLCFDGVRIQMADLQGFFTHAAFLHERRDYRVLPTLPVSMSHSTFVKQHNVLPLLGTHRHARPGGSSELLDLRDYLPGDPPKMIAWKVSARRDRLITREFESEVPIRCTLFVDTSNSVRVGPVGETALCRLVEVAAGLAQANASERDLTGLCLFDETGVRATVKAGRGSKHFLNLIALLTDVAGLTPQSAEATVRDLVPLAYGLAQDLYPELLDRDVNRFPFWLPLWSPQPGWAIPPGTPRYFSRLLPGLRREYRLRKELAAICAARYGLGPGGLAMLLEDDERCVHYLQRFLAEHQIACPISLYDDRGRYVFAAPKKPGILADALLKAVTRGKDNELFVLCVDLLENADALAKLERAICVAKARHHQVIVICPWPAGVDPPGARPTPLMASLGMALLLQRLCTDQLHEAFAKVRRALGRVGVPVLCAAQGETVNWILHHMRKLRIQERGVR
ncbi:MAG: DUF58 domain-containing protein [Planctomycetes bacterium]|nr:DUF58 domain-containing protein [Planctomycetota bacterium]